jgi:hypothetical protein
MRKRARSLEGGGDSPARAALSSIGGPCRISLAWEPRSSPSSSRARWPRHLPAFFRDAGLLVFDVYLCSALVTGVAFWSRRSRSRA